MTADARPQPTFGTPTLTRRRLLALAGALGVGAAGLERTAGGARVAAAPPKRGGVLRYGTDTSITSLDPHVFTGASADNCLGIVYSRLVQLSPDWNTLQPDLADRWDVSPDGKAYTFHVRPNVKFHDGSSMTSDDVVFTFQRIMDPNTGGYVRPLLLDVFGQVTAPDPSTVRFVLKQPYAAFLSALALPTAGIVSRKWVAAGGNLALTQMGTGPMRFVSLEPGVKITLARHSQYYASGLPYLDGIELVFLADDTGRATAVRNGSVDFIEFVPYRDMAAIQTDPHLRYTGDVVSSGLWAFPNLKRPPLDNPMVRQALNWAVNREAILKAAFFSHGAVMTTIFMPKTSWAYSTDVPAYGYDPDRAKDLLKRSGVKTPIHLDMLTSTIPFHKAGMVVFQANAQDLGIDVTLQAPEYAQFVKQFLSGDYQISVWGGGPAYADPDFLYTYFSSNGTIGRTTGYANGRLETLLEEARLTPNRTTRKTIYTQAYKIIMDDAVFFPFAYREQAEAMASYVQGYTRVQGSNWYGARVARTWMDK